MLSKIKECDGILMLPVINQTFLSWLTYFRNLCKLSPTTILDKATISVKMFIFSRRTLIREIFANLICSCSFCQLYVNKRWAGSNNCQVTTYSNIFSMLIIGKEKSTKNTRGSELRKNTCSPDCERSDHALLFFCIL